MSYENITDSDYIKRHREQTKKLIETKYASNGDGIEALEDANFRYSVLVNYYKAPDLNSHYWELIKLSVFNGDNLIAEMYRNYPSVNYCFAKQGDNEYLITSEDYQCITIIDLHTGDIQTYGNLDRLKIGGGFCPIEFSWDEFDNRLKITGCVWGCPYEDMLTLIPDLKKPDFSTAIFRDNIKQYDDWDEDDD